MVFYNPRERRTLLRLIRNANFLTKYFGAFWTTPLASMGYLLVLFSRHWPCATSSTNFLWWRSTLSESAELGNHLGSTHSTTTVELVQSFLQLGFSQSQRCCCCWISLCAVSVSAPISRSVFFTQQLTVVVVSSLVLYLKPKLIRLVRTQKGKAFFHLIYFEGLIRESVAFYGSSHQNHQKPDDGQNRKW